ncbi:MAG: hypothetical protein MK085_09210, partial [Phycisphaerales bacterium]|nr:hypothetical protein [Phycisphaerales bacterium]
VLEALLPAVAARLDSDVASLSADFQQRHLPTGHQVILDVDNDRVQGRLERVDPFGTLELQMESGLLSVPVERCRMLEWAPGSSG